MLISIVVKEFGNIDHLPDNLALLKAWSRVSQTWFFQTERLASEPFERKVLAVGAAHRQHLPLPVNAFGASSQSVQRRLRNPEAWRSS
ncbi:MAG TPA: hypothetical protein VFB60_01840 [Ktedonobacteraceae bacterium]|nr:hypothetical protein [Ktedonobacteraceae bacterium]